MSTFEDAFFLELDLAIMRQPFQSSLDRVIHRYNKAIRELHTSLVSINSNPRIPSEDKQRILSKALSALALLRAQLTCLCPTFQTEGCIIRFQSRATDPTPDYLPDPGHLEQFISVLDTMVPKPR